VLGSAEGTVHAMLVQANEPERLCSGCAAMVDPAVGSRWCSVVELGDARAVICENFVPLALHHKVAALPSASGSTDPEKLWKLICDEIEAALGPTQLDWLRNTRPDSFEDGCLRVRVSDDYTRSWLVARLMPAILEALELNGYADVVVEFSVLAEHGRVPPKRGKKSSPQTLPLTPIVPPAPAPERQHPHQAAGFNPAFGFEQFVVGTGNRLAHAGALRVAEGDASYNPLFLCGGVGVGKTHLLQAIGGRCVSRGRKALYVASETFTNELISAIRTGCTGDFRQRYRQIDVLLIDDIHFIIGKESTQEEFFHTFNWLHDAGKQIVLSSDRNPKEMHILDARLRSRFCWGLTADIQPPDFDTRVEILRRKALRRGRMLPDDVLSLIAGQTADNVRELEGMLNRLLALADLHDLQPDLGLATQISNGRSRHREIDHNDILQAVSAYFHLPPSTMSGKQRSRSVSTPRHIAMYLMREDGEMSLPRIGDVLGGRDHSTVIYGCDRVKREMATDGRMRKDVEAIRGLMANV